MSGFKPGEIHDSYCGLSPRVVPVSRRVCVFWVFKRDPFYFVGVQKLDAVHFSIKFLL